LARLRCVPMRPALSGPRREPFHGGDAFHRVPRWPVGHAWNVRRACFSLRFSLFHPFHTQIEEKRGVSVRRGHRPAARREIIPPRENNPRRQIDPPTNENRRGTRGTWNTKSRIAARADGAPWANTPRKPRDLQRYPAAPPRRGPQRRDLAPRRVPRRARAERACAPAHIGLTWPYNAPNCTRILALYSHLGRHVRDLLGEEFPPVSGVATFRG